MTLPENPVKHLSAFAMAFRTASIMLTFTLGWILFLALVHQVTHPAIEASRIANTLRAIGEVLPPDIHDNDLLNDTLQLPPTLALGLDEPTLVYRARKNGRPSALVIEAMATDGYAGKIRLLLGIRADGVLAGVRVTDHRETPGLGDYIDPVHDKNKEHPWIRQFDGLALHSIPERDWKVKKDGGRFDSLAGATISPRAVVKAVHRALGYVAENREALFAEPVTCRPVTDFDRTASG